MNRKYIAFGLMAFVSVIAWNAFLIKRDDDMYKAYYRKQAMENIRQPPSSDIAYSPKEKFCQSQAHWHPDCNVK